MADRVPLGKPLELSDDDLRAMTTPEEIQKAQADAAKLWRESVDIELRDLLDAIEIPL